MAQLTFTGRSGDGTRLLLGDAGGREHPLGIDARLRRALPGAPDSTSQLEIPMESSLRPRDIQTRIRAGETPESVAHAAGTSVEKIMAFAAPVLAERAHVAERAQLASVRRRSTESGARTLGEAVSAQLRSHNVDPAGIEWDAWRREDGRWTLTAVYDVAGRQGTATFSHAPRGSFVPVDADAARWLVGDVPAPSSGSPAPAAPAADDLAAARQRRLSSVGTDELPLGDDAIEMVTTDRAPAPADSSDDAESANEATAELTALGIEQPVEAYLEGTDDAPADHADAGSSTEEPAGPASEPAAAEPRSKPARKRGRASVPSWDEIMFGGGKND